MNSTPKHILLVDDEPDVRDVLAEVLQCNGYRTTTAATLEEAIQVVRSDRPNLVVTDLQLEESDGFAVVEEVKAIDNNIAVIMLTGMLMDPAAVKAASGGKIACYIEKIASLDRIIEEINRHMPK